MSRGGATLGPVLLNARKIKTRVRELGIRISNDYRGKRPHLIGILKGATIFHADLVRSIDLELSLDFIAVGSYGALTESSGEVRILKDLDESLEGKDVILVEDIVDTGHGRHMSADHDRRMRRQLTYHAAHFPRLTYVHDDRRDADDVVAVFGQFPREGLAGGKVEDCRGRRDILLDHHDAPGAMEHPQGEGALRSRYLVVVKLHRVHPPATVLVVLAVLPF